MTVKIEYEVKRQGYIVAEVDYATIEECQENVEKILAENKEDTRWASIDNLVHDICEV
jgi:hypothetical protein